MALGVWESDTEERVAKHVAPQPYLQSDTKERALSPSRSVPRISETRTFAFLGMSSPTFTCVESLLITVIFLSRLFCLISFDARACANDRSPPVRQSDRQGTFEFNQCIGTRKAHLNSASVALVPARHVRIQPV